MRLSKTLTAIAITGAAFQKGKVKRLLVVAPASVVPVWPKEFDDYANFPYLVHTISIHFNAGGGQGTEVFTYGGEKHAEAVRVCNALNKFGFVNRGIKDGSNLYVVRRSDAKAMLIEVCFVDTKSDVDLYNSVGVDRIAQAICTAIVGQEMNNGEDLTMGQYEELKQMIQAQQPMIYDYMDDNMPDWAKPTIQKLMDKGFLVGDDEGRLGLTMDAIRIFVANDRAGIYD